LNATVAKQLDKIKLADKLKEIIICSKNKIWIAASARRYIR
jgi:hypothetical protein